MLHAPVDSNDGAINGADMNHILAGINDKGNPCNTNPHEETQQDCNKPRHVSRLIADLCVDLNKNERHCHTQDLTTSQ